MAHSFDGATLKQLSTDHKLAVWSKTGGFVIKKIPGGGNVIQVIGLSFPRMSMPVIGTAAQMGSLKAKVGSSGTLIFHYETTTARLISMDAPVSIGIDNDLYTSALTFLRTA